LPLVLLHIAQHLLDIEQGPVYQVVLPGSEVSQRHECPKDHEIGAEQTSVQPAIEH
jgi:hypothetical protein